MFALDIGTEHSPAMHDDPLRVRFIARSKLRCGSGGYLLIALGVCYIVLKPTLLCALSVPSAAIAATAKYQVPLLRPVIS